MAENLNFPLEKDFQRYVLKKLREIPCSFWVKINDRATIGLPDILGCVSGVFFGLELKTRSRVTGIQAYTLRKIDDAGGQAFVVNPNNFAEVLAFIKKIASVRGNRPRP